MEAERIYITLVTLLERLENLIPSRSGLIYWGAPVPAFGDISESRVATIGLNPSNREFVDEAGRELDGPDRRFHTLASLGLDSWSDVDSRHLKLIIETCNTYFQINPYNQWFRKLDYVLSGISASYYSEMDRACHLDLIPYATTQKWSDLDFRQRSYLLSVATDTLALLLRDSPIDVIILNGSSVVEQFQEMFSIELQRREMSSWSLPRRAGNNVTGVSYKGIVDTLSGIPLEHDVMVLGYNHNIQGSFGVTSHVLDSIRRWIGRNVTEWEK